MNILFNCTNCSQEMSVEEAAIGMEIDCPNCGEKLVIPEGKPDPESSDDPDSEPKAAPPSSETEDKPAAETEGKPTIPATDAPPPKKLVVPVRPKDAPKERLEQFDHKGVAPRSDEKKDADKAPGKADGPTLKVKTIRRVQCLEMNHDHFDEVVEEFLATIKREDIVSINPTAYSSADSQGKILHDYGVLIIYKG